MKLLHENEEVITDQDDEIGFIFEGNSVEPFHGELICKGRHLNSKQEIITYVLHINECNFHKFSFF